MASLSNSVFDNGLAYLVANAERFVLCSAEPANYAGVAAVELGEKATPSVGAPADRAGGGREVTVSAISDGTVSADGTAAAYAIVDDTGSDLLATGSLSASQAVTNGNPFTTTSFTIGIPDPA